MAIKNDQLDPWIDRPADLTLMAWLGVIGARWLYAELGKEQFSRLLRDNIRGDGSGGNYRRWWRKYGKYIDQE